MLARARGGDRDAAETIARAFVLEARPKLKPQNIAVGAFAMALFVLALVLFGTPRGLGPFGVGILIGAVFGVVVGIGLGRRQRHSSRNDA
jgi:hypothetical protein